MRVAHRLERHRHGERRERHGERARLAGRRPEDRAQEGDASQVDERQHGDQAGVDQRPADDEVDVVQPVAEDRDAISVGNRTSAPRNGMLPESSNPSARARWRRRSATASNRPPPGNPLHLLAADPDGAPVAEARSRRRKDDRGEGNHEAMPWATWITLIHGSPLIARGSSDPRAASRRSCAVKPPATPAIARGHRGKDDETPARSQRPAVRETAARAASSASRTRCRRRSRRSTARPPAPGSSSGDTASAYTA